MKVKIFIDHNLSDVGVLLSDLIRVHVYFRRELIKDFLFTEIDTELYLSDTYVLIQEAVEDYKNKYIDGRISRMLDPIEDKVQVYELETKTYLIEKGYVLDKTKLK